VTSRPISGLTNAARHRLEITSDTVGELRVHAFRGREALSGLFRFDIDVSGIADSATAIAVELLGKDAVLEISAGAHRRRFGGVVASIEKRGLQRDLHRAAYRIRLVPRLWLLRLKRRSRIFQNMRVEDIVSAVLAESRIEARWLQLLEYPTREYCTQYEETDYELVRRLIAEVGAIFRYETRAELGEALVFGDSPALCLEHEAVRLRFTGESELEAPSTEVATRFGSTQRVRTNAAAYREYDFTRPQALLAARAAVASAPLDEALEHYEHHAGFQFTKWTYGEEEPARLLRQLRQRARHAAGASRSPLLQCGHRIALEDHPLSELNAEYAVTKVVHEGWDAPGANRPVYQNRFECVPSDVVYCLPRPKRKSVAVSLTATVVGPGEEEIHTEPTAQIKVQFHWDREGKLDDKSSCWLRTMQPWAGVGWGSQFVPRIGMEVVVAFDGGDPDKPFVLGCLYNGTHPPPFPLPGDQTRSGIRTRSTPSSEGFNELSFLDRAGEEQIYLRAERDLDEKVGRDHTLSVDRDRAEVVTRNKASRVLGSRSFETLGDEVAKTAGNSERHVGGLRTEKAGAGRRTVIQGDDTSRTTGRTIQSSGQSHSLRAGTNLAIEVGSSDQPGNADIYAFGNTLLGSGMTVTVRADQKIVLACGESMLELSKDTIKLSAPKLKLEAEKELTASGDGPSLRLDKKAEMVADSVRLYSSKASLELDEMAHLDGKLVKIACGPESPEALTKDGEPPKLQRLEIRMTDAKFEPYSGKEFVVKAGGMRVEGTTDGDGNIGVDLPLDATTADITMWLARRPTSASRRYVIELKPLDPPDTVLGLQVRLRHLGHYHRQPSGELDAATRHALEDFQGDQQLEKSGEPDANTRAKLIEAHGN